MKQQRIISLILAVIFTVIIFAGCSSEPKEKVFTAGDKFSITLDDSFTDETGKDETKGLTAAYASKLYGVTVLRETFETLQSLGYEGSALSEKDYLTLVMKANKIEGDAVEADGFITFTTEATANDVTFTYLGFIFKGSDSFWVVQMYSEKENFETAKPVFMNWAKTVTVK